jgi:hypothetical protein
VLEVIRSTKTRPSKVGGEEGEGFGDLVQASIPLDLSMTSLMSASFFERRSAKFPIVRDFYDAAFIRDLQNLSLMITRPRLPVLDDDLSLIVHPTCEFKYRACHFSCVLHVSLLDYEVMENYVF